MKDNKGGLRNTLACSPAHTRMSGPNRQFTSHQRQAVSLIQFRHAKNSASRTNITRPHTESQTYTSV
jgi:hypothetical protein